MIIGITGGIGSGKTTLSNLLRSNGYPVYDADIEARRLQNEDITLINQTKVIFGNEVYKANGLNRIAVADMVFQHPELLKQLTAIVHPIVKNDFLQWASSHNQHKLLFVESAVLFESNFNELTDKIILVSAPESIRIKRVMQRDGLSSEQVIARIKNQMSDTDKALKSDLIIRTDKGLPDDVLELIIVWQH